MDVQTGEANVFVSWFGVGVDGFQEQTAAGSGWDTALVVRGASPSVWRRVTPGTIYRFFVRGLDAGGRSLTDWAKSDQFKLDIVDSSLNGGGWATASGYNAYRGTLAYTKSGSSASNITYTVNGFAMAIAAPTSPGGGLADVYVDGQFARRISLHSANVEAGHLVFSWRWAVHGRHTVVLDPTSGKIDLDSLLVLAHP
jgi:hypothetical protein